MSQSLVLHPDLEITAEQFAAAWNLSPYASQYGPAHIQPATAETFISPEMAVALVTVAVTIPATILTSFVTEYLKARYIPKDKPAAPPPPAPPIIININQITLPDDRPLLIISQQKE